MFISFGISTSRALRALVLLPLLLIGQPAAALIIPATDTGWYRDDGTHDPDNVNYVTGFATDWAISQIPTEWRNFFVFDLSGVGLVSSATLRAYLVTELGFRGPGYLSPDASETWGLYDVSTNLGDLTEGAGGVGAFSDLGSGVAFGQAIVSASDMGSFIEVTLNAAALASIGSAGGLWALGGRLLDLGGADPEVIFAFSDQDPRVELELTRAVPAPTTSFLLALGLGALCWTRRNHQIQYNPGARL
jgi:hypothetical protein